MKHSKYEKGNCSIIIIVVFFLLFLLPFTYLMITGECINCDNSNPVIEHTLTPQEYYDLQCTQIANPETYLTPVPLP